MCYILFLLALPLYCFLLIFPRLLLLSWFYRVLFSPRHFLFFAVPSGCCSHFFPSLASALISPTVSSFLLPISWICFIHFLLALLLYFVVVFSCFIFIVTLTASSNQFNAASWFLFSSFSYPFLEFVPFNFFLLVLFIFFIGFPTSFIFIVILSSFIFITSSN